MTRWLQRLCVEAEDGLRYNPFARERLCAWKLLRAGRRRPNDSQAAARRVRDLCAAARLTTNPSRLRRCVERIRLCLPALDPARVDWSEFLPDADDPRLSPALILKPYIGEREKGLIYLPFEKEWLRLLKYCDPPAVAERYMLLLGPSSSPPHNLAFYALPAAFPGFLFTLISNLDDVAVLPLIAPNATVVPLFASSWVHPDRFRPRPRDRRDVDLLMVANFAKFKRHHALFGALRRMPPGLRVVLIGQDEPGRTAETIRKLARWYGVEGRFELLTDLPNDTVADWLCRARASVILSRREGSCVAVAESLFADTPAALLENAEVGSRAFINPATGRLLKGRGLARQLAAFVAESDRYTPRQWAEENSSCFRSHEILNAAVRRRMVESGQAWTRDVAPFYRSPGPHLARPEDGGWMRQERKEFEARFGALIGADEAESAGTP